MTPEQKQMLRDALLAALVVSSPLSLPFATLRMTARAAGFSIDDTDLARHLDYLVKSNLAETKTERLSAGVTRWQSTAAGVDYCEGAGLV